MRLHALLVAAGVLAAPVLGLAQDGVQHDPVACVIAGQFPRIAACVTEPAAVRTARVYFRAEGTDPWYHVVMAREAACFAASLPKPKRDLVGRHVEYYLEADHQRLGAPRTAEHSALVVRDERSCTGFVAKLAKAAPSAVFPALPAGFATGGASVGTAAIVGAGVAAAGGTAAAVGAASGGDETTTTTTTTATTQPPVSSTPPSTTLPGTTTLALECSATPDSGPLPLTVRFDVGATGVSVNPSFVWDFGDGTSAPGSAVQHVYTTAGRFTATVTGTAGTAVGTCARVVSAAVAPVATRTLRVELGGNGSGIVTSAPAGLDCKSACSAPFAQGTEVELRADPQNGSRFSRWGGACSGTGTCNLKMNSDLAVRAEFERVVVGPNETFTLTVNRTGENPAAVRSSPAGIDCGGDCSERYAAGTRVSLDLVSGAGTNFLGWSGDCGGTGACSVVMSQDRSVTARFKEPAPNPPVALTVALAGAGSGTVTGAGLNCPGTCSASQAAGSTVTIEARAGGASVFSGWSGDCGGASDNCTLVMSQARTARARFDALYRLDVSIQGQGRVRSDSQINCPGTCSETRVDGAVVTLVAQLVPGGGGFLGWDGACASQGTEMTCQVTMTQNRSVSARFGGVIPVTAPAPWRTFLEAPGARGVVHSGGQSFEVGPGPRVLELPAAEETLVTAAVTGGRAGTWRFEAVDAAAVEPGSLRVVSGEVVSVGPSGVTFRAGPGARLSFAYRRRAR